MTASFASHKPWISYTEQLAQLQARGMQVTDQAAALKYLERIGYYRLSGYWYPLRQIDAAQSAAQGRPVRSNDFLPNSQFEQVVKLYVFDKKLRLMALDALERIEMALRVDIAHSLGKLHPLAHTLPRCLSGHFAKQLQHKGPAAGRTEHALWLDKYQSLLNRARRDPAIAHNNHKYGQPPVWVAIEVWDFGLMSRLFAGMRAAEQHVIAQKYGAADGRELASWLRSLNFVRNVAAHHARLWNINILERCKLPASEPNWAALNNQRAFLYLCLMQKMLGSICPQSQWAERLLGLLDEFPSENFSLADMDIASVTQARALLGKR